MGNIRSLNKGGITNRSSSTTRLSYLERLPDDVTCFNLLPFLSVGEVVVGLGGCSWRLVMLLRERYEVGSVDIYPFEEFTPGRRVWRNVRSARLRTSVWNRRGVSVEEFLQGLTWSGAGFSLLEVKRQMREVAFRGHCTLSNFDLQGLQVLAVRDLKFVNIEFNEADLMVLQSLAMVESISFDGCFFGVALDLFPPKLKELRITLSPFLEEVQFGPLPATLELLVCENCPSLTPNGEMSPFPPALKTLEIAFMQAAIDQDDLFLELPKHLRVLEITGMSNIHILPALTMATLESLGVNDCPMLKRMTSLPSQLRVLKIEGCRQLEFLPIPSNLEEFECRGCLALDMALSTLPKTLKRLAISRCSRIAAITASQDWCLPGDLRELNLEGFGDLGEIPQFPTKLRSLTLRYCWSLQTIRCFPCTLEKIDFHRLFPLDLVPPLPKNLESLTLSDCGTMIKLTDPCFPPKLKNLHINGCLEVCIDFSQLPTTLECLCLENRSDIITIPCLPPKIKKLELFQVKELKALPKLPDSMRELGFQNCKSIRYFPEMPSGLRSLDLSSCDQVQYLGLEKELINRIGLPGRLPPTLKELDLCDCSGMENLGELPTNLESIDLSACNEEMALSSLPLHLETLIT